MDYKEIVKGRPYLREYHVKALADLREDQLEALSKVKDEAKKNNVATLISKNSGLDIIKYKQGEINALDKFINEINTIIEEVLNV